MHEDCDRGCGKGTNQVVITDTEGGAAKCVAHQGHFVDAKEDCGQLSLKGVKTYYVFLIVNNGPHKLKL